MTSKQIKVLEQLVQLKKEQTRDFINTIGVLFAAIIFSIFLPALIPAINESSDVVFIGLLNKIISWVIKLVPIILILVFIISLIFWIYKTIDLNRLKNKIEKEIDPEEIDKTLHSTAWSYFFDEIKTNESTEPENHTKCKKIESSKQ